MSTFTFFPGVDFMTAEPLFRRCGGECWQQRYRGLQWVVAFLCAAEACVLFPAQAYDCLQNHTYICHHILNGMHLQTKQGY